MICTLYVNSINITKNKVENIKPERHTYLIHDTAQIFMAKTNRKLFQKNLPRERKLTVFI